MHKWLFAERSAAMLWVPQRNQKLIRSSFPTSFDYESEKFPGTGKGPWSFVKQFGALVASSAFAALPADFAPARPRLPDWTGTIGASSRLPSNFSRSMLTARPHRSLSSADWVPFLSVTAALSFRRFLGGEARINEYCHSLAVAGGKRLQELFSAAAGQPVAIMENKKGELTANMVRDLSPRAEDHEDPTDLLLLPRRSTLSCRSRPSRPRRTTRACTASSRTSSSRATASRPSTSTMGSGACASPAPSTLARGRR